MNERIRAKFPVLTFWVSTVLFVLVVGLLGWAGCQFDSGDHGDWPP